MNVGNVNAAMLLNNYNVKRNYDINDTSESFINTLNTVMEIGKTTSALHSSLSTIYPGIKYHVVDTSNISQSIWKRCDFPFEKFFDNDFDESVLNWNPTSQEPSMLDSSVQARLNALRGKKAVTIPPALEEKINNNPAMAQDIMDKISRLMAQQDTIPGTIDSFVISFDEEGNIAHYRLSGGGGLMFSPYKGLESKEEKTEQEKWYWQLFSQHRLSEERLRAIEQSRINLDKINDLKLYDVLQMLNGEMQ